MEKLIEHRKQIKSRKPVFIRRDSYKIKRVSKVWRRPKGRQNKMRLNKRGYHRVISQGWRSPRAVNGLDITGKKIVHVSNIAALKEVDASKNTVIINSSVGKRKLVVLLKECLAKGISVKYTPDIQKKLDSVGVELKERKVRRDNLSKKIKEKESKIAESEKKQKEGKAKENKEGLDKKVEESSKENKSESKKETEKK